MIPGAVTSDGASCRGRGGIEPSGGTTDDENRSRGDGGGGKSGGGDFEGGKSGGGDLGGGGGCDCSSAKLSLKNIRQHSETNKPQTYS